MFRSIASFGISNFYHSHWHAHVPFCVIVFVCMCIICASALPNKQNKLLYLKNVNYNTNFKVSSWPNHLWAYLCYIPVLHLSLNLFLVLKISSLLYNFYQFLIIGDLKVKVDKPRNKHTGFRFVLSIKQMFGWMLGGFCK